MTNLDVLRPHLSIVVPAYNPQERIFTRVLQAIDRLAVPEGLEVECVIVDNNSRPRLDDIGYVQAFAAGGRGRRIVRELEQGLTFARLAGIRNTSGASVVVFDDDNLPGPDYLHVVTQAIREMPWVGVWGPGTIDVDLLDAVPARLQQRARHTHNERHDRFIQYGCIPASWQPFYPIGMGQVIRRDVADAYRRAVEAGTLHATDRKGGGLSGGGDNQIVWQAVNMGLAAGVHPGLRMTHVIPASRTTFPYLKRLAFGSGVSYQPCLAQSFPELRPSGNVPTTRQHATALAWFVAGRAARGNVRFLSVDFANLLGLVCGHLLFEGYGRDHWTFRLARRLGLE
jgi:hypothetical protein